MASSSQNVFETPRRHSTPGSIGCSTQNTSMDSTAQLTDDTGIVTMTIGQLRELLSETCGKKEGKVLKKDMRVPRELRNEIHTAVTHLSREEKNWDFGCGYKDGRNPAHTADVMLMVQNKLGAVSGDLVKKGCYTYFHTLKRQEVLMKGKKMEGSLKQQRRRQRMTNLRMRRLTSLNASKTISDKDRGNLMEILQTNEYISSEESEVGSAPSGSEDETEPKEGTKVLVKKKLLWRSTYVTNLFDELDKRTEKRRRRSQKGGASAMKRREGGASAREEPEDCKDFASMDFEEP